MVIVRYQGGPRDCCDCNLVSVGRIIHVHLLDALRGMYDVDLNAIQIWWIHLISSIVLQSYMSSGIVGIVVSCLIVLIGSR